MLSEDGEIILAETDAAGARAPRGNGSRAQRGSIFSRCAGRRFRWSAAQRPGVGRRRGTPAGNGLYVY